MRRTDDPHLDHPGKQGHADEHKAGFAEYVRLTLMALVIVASLTGWWRYWMSRDWLAFAATLIVSGLIAARCGLWRGRRASSPEIGLVAAWPTPDR